MERGGYPEAFNKITATPIVDPLDPAKRLEEYKNEFQVKKTQALSNLIEFAIGGILLTFCVFYLQTHPAEKVSLFSGIEVMWQKIQVWFSKMSPEDTQLLEQKTSLEKTMHEIVLLSKENDCVDQDTKTRIEESYQNLKDMSLEDYSLKQRNYTTIASLYYAKVKDECDK